MGHLAGIVERAVVEVIASHQGDIFRAHVELEVLEEGVGILRHEGDENAQGTRESGVDKALRTTGD